ncbi:MAG: radical SAM protein [Proteobacteria bacterium]|nr:radical SAM protein [Pseudomonadota bacterium]
MAPRPAPAAHRDREPAYLRLHRRGELRQRATKLWAMMASCRLCPRECGVNRLAGQAGFCRATAQLMLSAAHPHFGEERCLVGRRGSGTVFFTHCNLRCVFCINWPINIAGQGRKATPEVLARVMPALQKIGCHNINLVTPTHYSAHILKAVDLAAARDLRLPLVYNTSGWERLEVLKVLDGVVDIYLPDFKYGQADMAAKYSSGAKSYPAVTKQALLEMHRQVGVARPGKDGLLRRGLIIRHLVLPNNVSGTKQVLAWIAGHLPRDTYVNLMSQYRPAHQAHLHPRIARRLTRAEFARAVKWGRDAGLTRLDVQPYPRS